MGPAAGADAAGFPGYTISQGCCNSRYTVHSSVVAASHQG